MDATWSDEEDRVGPRRSSPPKHSPNARLTWERLQRGWSREELVQQIKRSMQDAGEPASGLNVEVVRRWESGDRKPEPRYQKHLVLVFELPASELGLLSSEEMVLRPTSTATPSALDEQLVDAIVRKVTMVLLGAGGEFNRKLFLTGLLGASLAPLLSRGMAIPEGVEALTRPHRNRLDPGGVDAFSMIVASHRDLYWSSPAVGLLPSVVSHAQFGENLLKATSGTDESVRRLGAAVAESALLAARLAFFDLDQTDLAESFFQLAQDAADLSGDHTLTAAVLAHRAFVPGFAGREQDARAFLKAAHAHARYNAGPLLRSWLYCVDSEVSVRIGHTETGVARIRSAEDALTTTGTDPVWLDFFDPSRLDGFAGTTLLLAGRPRAAELRLQGSLGGLADNAGKQRAVLLLDLAAAQAPTDAEQACATARQACDVLVDHRYATALKRVPAVQQAVSTTRYAAELGEQVHALKSTVGMI
ncbi:helix-turn-helix domain-containing protein [Actinosynnema sp. CS-041913]|uniref:helix-turn-helix domain-containing protein n=1 Tax=Actinosynnema sp. CS-041913 TaxID=3239917 RepID=UPI003D8C45A8